MSFRFVLKWVTLNDLERRNGRHFALFQRISVASGKAPYQRTLPGKIKTYILHFRRDS